MGRFYYSRNTGEDDRVFCCKNYVEIVLGSIISNSGLHLTGGIILSESETTD